MVPGGCRARAGVKPRTASTSRASTGVQAVGTVELAREGPTSRCEQDGFSVFLVLGATMARAERQGREAGVGPGLREGKLTALQRSV